MNVHKMFLRPGPRGVLMATAMAAGLALLAGCDSQADSAQQAPPPPQVSVAEVVVKDVRFWDEFTGRIAAVEEVELRPRVAGYLDAIHYTEGQTVDEGDVLFTIDPRPYQADLARAEAELQRARARAELARAEARRAESLSPGSAISRQELDQRRATAVQAEVERARLNVEFTEVRAPIAGRTGRALITVGNLVSDATPLTSIVSLDRVHVHFFSDERRYLQYDAMARNGERPSSRDTHTPVRVGLASDEGYPYRGEVDFIDNRLDAAAGTILIRAVLDNREGRFAPGMFARVQLRGSGAEDAMLIDDKAVLTDQDRKYVYVVDDEGRAQRRDVELGRRAEGLRVVTTGLEAGDRVVVRGAQRIFFPGMEVAAESVEMQAEPPVAGDLAAAH